MPTANQQGKPDEMSGSTRHIKQPTQKKTLLHAWLKPKRNKATEQGETQKKKSKAKQNTSRPKHEESSKSRPIRGSTKANHTRHGQRADTRHAKSSRDATTHTTREKVMCNKRQPRPNKREPTRGANTRLPHRIKLRSDGANRFAPKRANKKKQQF